MRRVVIVAGLAWLCGCATVPTPEKPPPIASENNAVVALVQSARDEMSAGRLNLAASRLERALRIEPHNPALWHELARVNLHQGQAAQAAEFASKSNSFAGDDNRLRAANWRLIGQARTQIGDQTGAEAAFAKASELERER